MEGFNPGQFLLDKFPYLKEEDLMTAFSIMELKQVPAGELVVSAGDMNYNYVMVVQGILRNYIITPQGEERTILFSAEGKNTGSYATIFSDRPATEYIDAIEPCVLALADMRNFEELADKNPRMMKAFKDGIKENLVDAIERLEDYTILSNEERYKRFFDKYPELIQRIPQKYLASYFGVTPVTLSRIKARILRKPARN